MPQGEFRSLCFAASLTITMPWFPLSTHISQGMAILRSPKLAKRPCEMCHKRPIGAVHKFKLIQTREPRVRTTAKDQREMRDANAFAIIAITDILAHPKFPCTMVASFVAEQEEAGSLVASVFDLVVVGFRF